MYGDRDNKNGDFDDKLYAIYYNEEEHVEQNPDGDTQDSDIDADEVDRLYSQIYHEIPCESDMLEESYLLGESNISDESGILRVAQGNISGTEHKINSSLLSSSGVQYLGYAKGDGHVQTTGCLKGHGEDPYTKVKPSCSTNSVKSTLKPDLKTMLFNRSVDVPDSDSDHVEIIYNRNTNKKSNKGEPLNVKELHTVNKPKSGCIKKGLDKCDTTKFIKSDSVVESKSCNIKLSSGKQEKLKEKWVDGFQTSKRDVSYQQQSNCISLLTDSSSCESESTTQQKKYKTVTCGKNKSKQQQNSCISVSTDSSSSEHKQTKKKVISDTNISNMKKITAASSDVIVLDDSSSVRDSSDSESSSSDVSSLVTISSDLSSTSSFSSSELCDSSAESFSDSLTDLRADLQINVNRNQQHLLDVTMEKDSENNFEKKKAVWGICERDQFGGTTLLGRYYQPSTVLCRNCNYVGHMSKHCPQPKKSQTCILCGLGGHHFRQCPNSLCYNCDTPGHNGRHCPQPRRHRGDLCTRCGMRGHRSDICPDIWRQYHLTTKGDLKVPQKHGKPNPRVYCYNCARGRHFGHECLKARQDLYSLPTSPFVAYYGEFKENKKQKGFTKGKSDVLIKKQTFHSSRVVDFPRSSPTHTLPNQIFSKKRKLQVDAVENGTPTKHCKANPPQLQDKNKKNKKRKEKLKNTVTGDESGDVKKGKKKKSGDASKEEESTSQNSKHQVNDNQWWTEKYKLCEEKKRRKKERRKQRILENPELKKKRKKTNKYAAFNTAIQKCAESNKNKLSLKSVFRKNITKPKVTERGFFISKVAQSIVDR